MYFISIIKFYYIIFYIYFYKIHLWRSNKSSNKFIYRFIIKLNW